MTAEELATAAGQGLTRSVIANVESGRKRDLPSAQVVAIAWALTISPVLLLVDLSRPYATGIPDVAELTNFELALWAVGEVLYAPPGTDFDGSGIPRLSEAVSVANSRLTSVKNIYKWEQRLAYMKRQLEIQSLEEAKDYYHKEIETLQDMISDAEHELGKHRSSDG